MMRVLVAVGALIKGNAGILWLAVGSVRMALGALHLGVQTGQRIARFGMVELPDVERLPVLIVVALQAVRTQPAFVLILVAGHARGGQAQIAPVKVLVLDRSPLLRTHVQGAVAAAASEAGVLAFQHVTGIFVIEGLDVPFDQGKVFAVVFRMAARTFLAGTQRNVKCGVQAAVGRKANADLGMTLQALHRCLAAELVALGAIDGPVERLVRAGEGPGRNLGGSPRGRPDADEDSRCEKDPVHAPHLDLATLRSRFSVAWHRTPGDD